MARKISTTKTAEQRREQAEQLQATITAEVEALRESAAWERFLTFAQSFHAYSLNNLMLILSQYPAATRVAGFRKWQELHRQVRKGEKSIKIFGYAERKAREGEDTTGMKINAKGEPVVPYFPMLSVFDIAQTDPGEGWEEHEISHRLTGQDDAGIYEATADYLTAQGWTVTREHIGGETNGYTTTDGTQRVVIDADLAPAQAAKTILHEAAHVILHAEEDPAEYIEHRGIKETEAESVAYIVAGILEMDTSSYSIGYVAGWSDADADLIKDTAANVLRAAHTIADAITHTEATETAA
jgi:antirestriction protein ArdC